MRVLITGGAGFVGASLARFWRARFPAAEVVALDNLRRRGSEQNARAFAQEGIVFRHGDVRCADDLAALPGNFDVLLEASAEPSVQAGLDGAPRYLIDTNLLGCIQCLEFARRRVGQLVFLSSSRVYSIEPLRTLALDKTPTRLEIAAAQQTPGVSQRGICEDFPTHLPRSLYGATKLAAELLIQEYAASYNLRAVINRCGVIAGPGQFGRADQGIVGFWVGAHHFGRALRYTGFGGTGHQVRDLLHPDDLCRLIAAQLESPAACAGQIYNVGGGREVSVSLMELTSHCREAVGRAVPVACEPRSHDVDIPLYISDASRARAAFGWSPARSVEQIISETAAWVRTNENALRPLFSPARAAPSPLRSP